MHLDDLIGAWEVRSWTHKVGNSIYFPFGKKPTGTIVFDHHGFSCSVNKGGELESGLLDDPVYQTELSGIEVSGRFTLENTEATFYYDDSSARHLLGLTRQRKVELNSQKDSLTITGYKEIGSEKAEVVAHFRRSISPCRG